MEREEWTRDFIRAIHRSPQSEEYLEAITQAALSTPTNATAIMIANLILMGPTDLRPALNSLDRPALFIASSQDWAVEQAGEQPKAADAGEPQLGDGMPRALSVAPLGLGL